MTTDLEKSRHEPVLLGEVLEVLRPGAGEVVVDCTVGYGGHAARMLEMIGAEGLLLGIDLDANCVESCGARLMGAGGNVQLWQGNFAATKEVLAQLGGRKADVVLGDLGVNSRQFDEAGRGFSFSQEGPLRMVMDEGAEDDAEELVNTLGENELGEIIRDYGEERHWRRVARYICTARRQGRIETTKQLAGVVMRAIGPAGRRQRIHPATRTFQALRIAVNHELDNLRKLLDGAEELLAEGGRIGIISFHSLEDRIVKHAFRQQGRDGVLKVLTKSPIRPGEQERKENPRSRSAKLRAAQRLG